jgi:hypothetical protein
MKTESPLARLIEMHRYQRPAGSRQERKFINRYIRPFGATVDAFQNWTVVIGENPRHVWSSHTDTVHKRSGKQNVMLDASGILSSSSGDCLGADDTAGVWLMCELIRRRVSGRYVFHYGEERGCIGSRNLVRDNPSWLSDVAIVIALDRMHTDEVITHQCGRRTASDAFAEALADQLNAGETRFRYRASEHGMYTDSESYAEAIAECTNLAVGYSGQHGRSETLDTHHALALLERLTVLDVSILPVSRKPGEDDGYSYHGYSGVSDDTFWNRYGGFTGSERSILRERITRMYPCEDCGELCEEDDDECYFCGCQYPTITAQANAIDEEESAREERANDYLDRVYGDVQTALRADMKRRRNAKR